MVIYKDMPVSSKWTLVNIEHDTVKDCENWFTDVKCSTDVDKNIMILFQNCAKVMAWHKSHGHL